MRLIIKGLSTLLLMALAFGVYYYAPGLNLLEWIQKQILGEEQAVIFESNASPENLQIATWNLCNFGKSKNEEELEYIASQIKDFDIIGIQEVSTSAYGAKALAKLADALNRTGNRWDYELSDPTIGAGKERYAFLWRPKRAKKIGKGWILSEMESKFDREPFLGRFQNVQGESLLLINFHAVPSKKKPENEIVLLDQIHKKYVNDNLILMGDFNLSESHLAFDNLKAMGYRAGLYDQATTLKRKYGEGGVYLLNDHDNVFYERSAFLRKRCGVIDFVNDFPDLKSARQVSDHLPIWIEVEWKAQ